MSILILGTLNTPLVYAQFNSAGGVNKPGSWWLGEGLKKGDFFSYNMCHVDYKECAEFSMDLWIKGDKQVGTETKWLAEAVVYDGNKVVVGEIELGKLAAEPTGGSPELGVYKGAFKSSVAWLSAFATADSGYAGKGPKEFKAASWGKIGNIGGEQVIPSAMETVKTRAGTWDTVVVSWKTGGYFSKVWVVDDFPFPVKAFTYTHVSEGIPPPEYIFELIDYKQNVQNDPFVGIVPTANTYSAEGCNTNFERTEEIKKPTENFDYQVHVFYGPDEPTEGCPMQMLIKFISKYDETEFLNQVQFDVLVVDDNLKPLRSLAQGEGRQYLYSPSGQYLLDMIVNEKPGKANYVIWVYGLAPEGIVPSTKSDYLKIPLQVYSKDGHTVSTIPTTQPKLEKIPDWIKNNAGWWADGSIDDNSFVQGIQFLIQKEIIVIPPTSQGASSTNQIPDWIKNNAGWWADGSIDDSSFIQGLQFLIKEGIMKVTSTKDLADKPVDTFGNY
jgi:hypothetical protein